MRLSLLTLWSALVGTLTATGILIALGLDQLLPNHPTIVVGISLLCLVPLAVITIRAQLQRQLSLYRADRDRDQLPRWRFFLQPALAAER